MLITNDTLRSQYPGEAAWLTQNYRTNDFANSLVTQARQRGGLTERQLNAVTKILSRPQRVSVDVSDVVAAFASAKDSGLKRPKLRLDGLCFSMAGPHSANAGAIYLKSGGDYHDRYYGKINDGEFSPASDCPQDVVERVAALDGNLLEAAQLYGQETGECSMCGRELTDPNSIELGIGPVCKKRWGL